MSNHKHKGSQNKFPTKQNWSATREISDNRYNPNLPKSLTKSNPNLPKLLLTRQKHATKRDLPGTKAAGQGTATFAGHG